MLITIVGYRGSGKSTVGGIVAEKLDMGFLDMDEEIVRREGMSVMEIFQVRGEAFFREKEAELAVELSGREGLVVATGGGAPANAGCAALLEKSFTAYLEAPAEVLSERIAIAEAQSAERPPLLGDDAADEVESVLSKRVNVYEKVADFRVSTEIAPPDYVAGKIADAAREFEEKGG